MSRQREKPRGKPWSVPFFWLAVALAALVIGGCATVPPAETRNRVAYAVPEQADRAARYAPILVPEYAGPSYNRIGKPSARYDSRGRERIFVDPDSAVVYVQQQDFETDRGRYTNLIYRVHFERVPFSLIPFHLTTGKNSGLLFVVTLDEQERPVLLTTVHTCGCYLAQVPTRYLPREAYPKNWNESGQKVFGMRLPGLLDYPERFDIDYRPIIFLKHGTHRIKDIGLARLSTLDRRYELRPLDMQPMEALKKLPLDGETTSFYHNSGFRKGYVKGASKPLEMLFMSWWALDPNIGVDKEYGDRDETGTVFYTSLKPWARDESDMWRFREFLEYWGWRF